MMWGLSGAGVKGGGGSGGIFQVGKSNAKKLRKKISMLLSRMLQGGKRPRRKSCNSWDSLDIQQGE